MFSNSFWAANYICDSAVQTNNVARYFVQSVLDLFIVRHWYYNICCTDPLLIKKVQFLPILETGTEAWKETPLAWGNVRALAEQEIEKRVVQVSGGTAICFYATHDLVPFPKWY